MSNESNVLFDVFELYARTDENDFRLLKLIGYYYIPGKTTINVDETLTIGLYRHVESEYGTLDYIFSVNLDDRKDPDLGNFLYTNHFYKYPTGTVVTFTKEHLLKLSRLRLNNFDKEIEALPSFQW